MLVQYQLRDLNWAIPGMLLIASMETLPMGNLISKEKAAVFFWIQKKWITLTCLLLLWV